MIPGDGAQKEQLDTVSLLIANFFFPCAEFEVSSRARTRKKAAATPRRETRCDRCKQTNFVHHHCVVCVIFNKSEAVTNFRGVSATVPHTVILLLLLLFVEHIFQAISFVERIEITRANTKRSGSSCHAHTDLSLCTGIRGQVRWRLGV